MFLLSLDILKLLHFFLDCLYILGKKGSADVDVNAQLITERFQRCGLVCSHLAYVRLLKISSISIWISISPIRDWDWLKVTKINTKDEEIGRSDECQKREKVQSELKCPPLDDDYGVRYLIFSPRISIESDLRFPSSHSLSSVRTLSARHTCQNPGENMRKLIAVDVGRWAINFWTLPHNLWMKKNGRWSQPVNVCPPTSGMSPTWSSGQYKEENLLKINKNISSLVIILSMTATTNLSRFLSFRSPCTDVRWLRRVKKRFFRCRNVTESRFVTDEMS